MKSHQSELSKIFLEKLDELNAEHARQMQSLVSAHEAQQLQQQEFFAKQQQEWERKVTDLSKQVQGLQLQLTHFSKSLKPLTEQLNSLVTLSNTLRDS